LRDAHKGATENPPAKWEIHMPAKAEMDAVALLKADHRKVEELFEKFESAKGASAKQKLVEQICTELVVHSTIEEEIFYPACTDKIEDEELLQEAYVEHDGAKVLIAELTGSEPDAEFYDAKVKVLSEMIKHHVKEEEKRSEGLFAEAKEAGLDMDELGARMQARKEELLAEIKKNGLPTPQTRSFTGHDLQQGSPVDQAA
jgi:hemerythrin superfamily protein